MTEPLQVDRSGPHSSHTSTDFEDVGDWRERTELRKRGVGWMGVAEQPCSGWCLNGITSRGSRNHCSRQELWESPDLPSSRLGEVRSRRKKAIPIEKSWIFQKCCTVASSNVQSLKKGPVRHHLSSPQSSLKFSKQEYDPVSYTHLTLPTKLEV